MRIIPACISGRHYSLTSRIILFADGSDISLALDSLLRYVLHCLNSPGPLSTLPSAHHHTVVASYPLPAAMSSRSAGQQKAHNIATFAGAVGGSVGLLAVLALSLAISIYRRRLHSQRRDRRRVRRRSDPDFDGESFHTDGSEDSPPMQGPAPFVPRYFPGTVVPAPPPPYSPPTDATVALLSSASPVSWGPPLDLPPGEDRSYADRPPPSPPPLPEDGMDDFFAPPSFPAAISSPIPAILAGYSPVATSVPVSTSPVPRHTNGSGSRGVYATDPPPSRSRANSDAQSQRSGYSDRPPSFASQAPPLIPLLSQPDGEEDESAASEAAPRRTFRAEADRASVRSIRSR